MALAIQVCCGRFLLLSGLIALGLLASPCSARDLFAPPAGISPANVSLETVLSAARRADGSDGHFSTRVEKGRVTAWGLKGTFSVVESGQDYKVNTDLDAIAWERGRTIGQLWRRNENGLVIALHDEARAEADTRSVDDYTHYGSSQMRLLGEVAGPPAAYVVEATTEYGSPKWFFFDKGNALLVRVEVPHNTSRNTYTYDDFRRTGSFQNAWHEHVTDGIKDNDWDFVTTSLKYNGPVTPADTAMPDSNASLLQFPAGSNVVQLPSKVTDAKGHTKIISVENSGHDITANGDMSTSVAVYTAGDAKVLVQLTVGGRGYDFFLDSGASGIFMDSDLAQKLGLKSFGPVQRTPFGSWAPGYAVIPKLSAGAVSMNNVIVHTLPGWHDNSKVGSDVVGLVGFDFLANAVLSIDYEKGVVTAVNPFFFVPPAEAYALPVTLDEGVPSIAVQIGQTASHHFILDTGSNDSWLSKSFALAHPTDVKDQGRGVNADRIWLPWIQFETVRGGTFTARATEVKNLTVSGVSLDDWLMLMDQTDAFELNNDDGLIGYDFLKFFTVYLDYPHSQVFLLPNNTAKARAAH
ncbi:MAG: retroviral-like aspartic protease family protein [Candidatus Eremiobacteraeota bacterium]|nr:retroviral-like aspartic protease family protein [Candidatus Eremiobacteraeota bacterium]